MRPECLEFSPSDSLDMVQYVNPSLWLVDIQKPVTQIITYRSMHKITCNQALDAILAVKHNMADKILAMAAFQFIMDEKVKMYNEAVANINSINNQMLYTQNSKLTSASEKAQLMEYYQDQLKKYEQEREDLLQQPDVCKAIEVQYNTVNTAKKK